MDALEMLSSSEAIEVNNENDTIEDAAKNIVEENKSESSSAEAPEQATSKEMISPRFALLAREEKRLQEERKRLNESRKDPEFQEFLEFKKLKASAKNDPLSVLEKMGLNYDEITDYVISGKHTKDPSIRALEEKIAQMEKEAQERELNNKKALEEAQLNNFKESIKAVCLEKSDDFELVNIWGAHNLVYNVIQEHYDKTQQVLPIEEAAKKVESYLEKESEKYQGSKKLRKLFGAPDLTANDPEKPTLLEEKQSPQPTQSMSRTLSNSVSSGSTSTEVDDNYDPRVLLEKAKRLLER